MTYILAIAQGTTSSRAIIFDAQMRIKATAQEEFTQHFPQSGWVEHDVSDIWSSVAATCRGALEKAGITASDVAAIGITNQRETTIVWDKNTGEPVHNAIVWQDRRTAPFCEELRREGFEATITRKTGLLADPYFSGTKVQYILHTVEGAKARADAGDLLFGTVDSYLIWKLTGGKRHVTDATNAARTMLYDIRKGGWSTTICDRFGIPMSMLPEVLDCAAEFGTTRADLFGKELPILGVAGDQQAEQLRGRGGIMLQPFFDLNANDVHDPDESYYTEATDLLFILNAKPIQATEPTILDARVLLRLPSGRYRLDLDPAGFPLNWKTEMSALAVDVVAGSYTPVPIPFQPSYTVIGVISAPDGNPLAGAKVEAVPDNDAEAIFSITNGAGVYVLEALPQGRYQLQADGVRFEPSFLEITDTTEPFQELNLQTVLL